MNAQPVARIMTDDEYEEFLDECFGEVTFGNLTFSAGRIIRELDPIAFDIGKSEEEDSLTEDDPHEWQCEKCQQIYDNEDDAEECCQTDDTDEDENDKEEDK